MAPDTVPTKPIVHAAKPVTDHILLPVTDKDLPRHITNGFLRYGGFRPYAEGGTAFLEECVDKNLGRVVLMKRLHPHLKDVEIEQKRFLREARVTALIQHPATVPVYEISRDRNGDVYFTMKKLEGVDLREILAGLVAGDPFYCENYPLTRLIEVLVQVGQAVAFAHVRGVIHRDLKPANILVGGFGEVMILDWGLAKVWNAHETQGEVIEEQDHLAMELTRAGKRCGTPLYMSPEQASGQIERVDARSDIYSLGAILYEVLTHENLVWGTNKEDVLRMIVEEPAVPPRKRSPERKVPAELDSICMRAIEKEPAQRYGTMLDMVEDLRSWLLHKPVIAHTYTPWERFINWEQRNVLLTVFIGATLLGSLLTLLLLYLLRD